MLSDELTSERSRRGGNRRRKGAQPSVLMVNVRMSEQRAERIQRIAALAVLVAAVAGIGAVLLFGAREAGRSLFSENPLFTIRDLDVASDGKLTPTLVREYTGLRPGLNLFGVDIARVRATLARVPLVREVRVSRHLPDRLEVRIVERTPLARLMVPKTGLCMAVDRDGVVLGPSAAASHLPVLGGLRRDLWLPGEKIVEPEFKDALDLLDLCDRTRLCQYVSIRSIDVADPEHLDLRLAADERVTLPRHNMESKLRRLATILKTIQSWHLQGDQKLDIDMCTESNFPVAGLNRAF